MLCCFVFWVGGAGLCCLACLLLLVVDGLRLYAYGFW